MKKNQTAIIILAAGKGTRMKSSMPKVLHKICGKPMVSHVIDTSLQIKPQKIITVLGPNMQDLADFVADASDVVIQKNQLGTGDAVKPALKELANFTGNILILYADTPLISVATIKQMVKKLNNYSVAVLGFCPKDAAEYGRLVVDDSGQLLKIVEYKDASAKEREINLCNSGVIAARGPLLQKLIAQIDNNNAKGEYYLTDVIELAQKSGNKCCYVQGDEEEVLGVNNRVQLSQAEHIFQTRLRNIAMMNGVSLIDPETTYLCHDTKFAEDVIIGPNVSFGPGVLVEKNVLIKPFCHIEGAKIKSGAIIGPFARIRPGTYIGDDAHIGNFVEIKKSKIADGVKIGHLSYIGDTEIGSNTNIGAGTITCNFDGRNKNKTKIGKSVFIGSNSALVAPVNIGDKSFVAAGSTITENIPAKSLALARSRQVNKPNKQF